MLASRKERPTFDTVLPKYKADADVEEIVAAPLMVTDMVDGLPTTLDAK